VTAGDVYRALWRHKLFIAALTALFVGAAWFVTSRESRKYEASTLVRVQARGPDAGNASAALLASQTLSQTYARIIDSGALEADMRRLIARCLVPTASSRTGNSASSTTTQDTCAWVGGRNRGRISLRQFSEATIAGDPVEDLDLLSITVRSTNPTRAMVVANAAPRVLRSFIRTTGSRSERVVIVKAADVPTSPVSRQLPLKLAIALVLGLIFNGALALLIELFRDRLPEVDELGRALGHPVLATVPALRLHPVPVDAEARDRDSSAVGIDGSRDGERGSGPRGRRVTPEP
jgi:capsular polysaccharide biosynthesis protein